MNYKTILGFAVFVGIWYVISNIGIIDPLFIESPEKTFVKLIELFATGNLVPDIAYTLGRVFLGFFISMGIGIPVGLALGYSRTLYDIFQPLVDFFRSVPATALFPLFLLFFGISDFSKVAIVIFGSSLLIIINSMYGVHHANKTRILLAKTFGAKRKDIFEKVVFYEALPSIFVGLRLAISLSLVLVVVSEMILSGTNTGLGLRIFNAHLVYNIAEMYSAIIVTGIIGYILNILILRLERKLVHYAGK